MLVVRCRETLTVFRGLTIVFQDRFARCRRPRGRSTSQTETRPRHLKVYRCACLIDAVVAGDQNLAQFDRTLVGTTRNVHFERLARFLQRELSGVGP